MVDEGLPERDARGNFFLVDRPGLLHDGLKDLRPFQQKLLQPKERVDAWRSSPGQPIGLLEVVKNARPTILIGVSGQPGTFTEEVVRAMASHVERPIIFPLSNPTSRSEATPSDLLTWTNGHALIATGSPFDDVSHGGRRHPIAQCNNSYIFPALGLGVRAAGARRVNAAMFMAVPRALANCSPARHDPLESLLPPLSESQPLARTIALAVAASESLLAMDWLSSVPPEELERLVDAKIWHPRYLPMKRKQGGTH